MRVPFFRSLATRLVLLTALLLVLVGGALVAMWVESERETLRADLERRARVLAGSSAIAISNELWNRDYAQLQGGLEALMDLDPTLVYVFLSDEREGHAIVAGAPRAEEVGEYVPDLVRAAVTEAALAGRRSGAAPFIDEAWLLREVVWRGVERGAPGDRIIEASAAIGDPGVTPTGIVRIGISLRPVARAAAAALRRALAFGAAALAAGLAGAWLLARRITGPVLDLSARALRVREGDLAVEFPDRSGGDEIALLSHTMAEMIHGLRDRDFIRDVFGRYVTPELADELLENRDSLRLGGHLQHVVMLMSDLRGFTSLSARLGPEAMVALLNAYLARMTSVIIEHRGTINEFIGDAIFALFGAPIEREDDAFRAACCAIAMQKALDDLNRRNVAEGLPELHMGIGINAGEVIAGNIGSEQRVKYGVVGDAVNMTSRIESLTTTSQVLVSEAFYLRVKERVVADGPREAQVKGKAESLRYYELRAIAGRPDLAMPERAPETVASVRLAAEVWPIRGKEVAAEPEPAEARGVGARTLVLETVAPLEPLDNVKLRLRLDEARWTGDLYAKVETVEPGEAAGEGRRRASLALTAAADADREELKRIAGSPSLSPPP